ncbi:eukaryotic translation initiation factor 3 subunit L isoform X2 [Bacillus rossius redtenbacheri]|uniref:eukaryotic translation initiation factor 3 subunit L isoform X2 n=1 Tax=Bacillus rossius redtenbacheri TaxID=93214 RepID=UPI002FDCF633
MYGNDDYVDQGYAGGGGTGGGGGGGGGGYDYGYGAPPEEGQENHGDADYDRQFYKIPDMVKKFITYFRNCVSEGLIFEIQNLYENTFPKLTEQYFDKRPWPDDTEIAHLVDNDPMFLILYKELYFRHIYARIPGGPTLEQRYNSFYNYCDLFNYILNADKPVLLELPDQWLWELIDEFVYQFQSFSQFRARLQKMPDEMEVINNNKVWYVLCVLNVLHSLVDKSNIKRQLEVYASGGDPDSVAGDFGRHSLYKMLGYYSLVGLLRLHSLLGDYYQAIKVLENIELHKKSQYSHIPACQISTAYYVGFAYMMMRRYSDAIRTFSSILLFIQRTKQLFQTRSYQNDQEFEACFLFACPKFLSPAPPAADAPAEDYAKEATRHQTKVFMDEVRQQKMLPTIRSYLKLYTTLPLSKLATFMSQAQRQAESTDPWDLDKEVKALTIHLLCFKHKMKNVVWTKGTSGLDGKFQSGSELDFYIDNQMIHIADTKVAHRYGDFFMRKILKFEELNRKLHMIKI